MKTKHFAGGAFLLNTLLFGSYYAISKEVLGRIDPIVFFFGAMMILMLPALIILARSWPHIIQQTVKSGFVLGSRLSLPAIIRRYDSATGTGFFPGPHGQLAALWAGQAMTRTA